jgi:ABC-type uncharacterized transport system involved in gliding motility auxiliary subunit
MEKLRKYSIFGLYLSALAVFSLGVYYFLVRKTDIPFQILAVVLVLGLAIFAIFNPDRIRKFIAGRQFKYGGNSLLLILGVIGTAVVLNILANKYSPSWDVTNDSTNTLAPESIAAAQAVPQPVKALAFFTPAVSTDSAQKLLELYKENSNGLFDYEFIDPDSQPAKRAAYNVTKDGSLVLEMNGNFLPVSSITEQDITTTIIKLINPVQHGVYFLTGHGEHDPFGTDENGYNSLTTALTAKNYRVASLNLMAAGSIPADAEQIIVAGPQKPLSAGEVELLRAFVASGRSLIYLIDPTVITQFNGSADPLAIYLASDWGINIQNDFIVDPGGQNPTYSIANDYGDSPITQKLQKIITIFPSARGISLSATPPAGVTLTGLVMTSASTWGETDLAGLVQSNVTFDASVDQPGPVTLAVAAENPQTHSRVVVVGNSNFVINQNYSAYANSDFMINAVDWSAQEDQIINLTVKPEINRLIVPPQSIVINIVLLVVVLLIPLMIAAVGVIVFIGRRKKG